MTRYSAGYKGPMLPAAGPRGSAQTAGAPAGPSFSPRGAMTGGARPGPTRPMSTGPSLNPRGAIGGRPAPTSPMKKGGKVAKKAAPKKR